MLIRLQKLDYKANYYDEPPTVEVICATSLIASIEPHSSPREEDCSEITFVDGEKWQCLGTASEILSKMEIKVDGEVKQIKFQVTHD